MWKRDEPQVRWLIRRDMDEVLRIERASFEKPWTEEEFLCCLRQRNCIGSVVEDVNCDVRGFMIYELHRSTLRILNLAVDPSCRGLGYGRMMVERLINKLHQQRRREIVLEIRETNLNAHLFFQHMGFRCLNVLRNHYDDTNEDAYYFRYVLPLRVQNGSEVLQGEF